MRLRPSCLVLVGVTLAAPILRAEDAPAWPSLRGSGLLTLPDLRTLAPRRFSLAANVDNRDRDPLGLDQLDGSAVWTLGLAPRLETYGYYVFSRVVALPEPPPLPAPPVDLILAPGTPAPEALPHSLYPPTPYVNKRGTARFDDWVPGDVVFGLKLRLREPQGPVPGLALSGELKLPATRDRFRLQSGAGTGGTDVGVGAIAGWNAGRNELLARIAYVRTGAPALHDRLIHTAGGAASVTEQPLALPDRFELGAGLRRPFAAARAAIVVEASTELQRGRPSALLDSARPVDVLAGLQWRPGRLRLAGALRYHGNALTAGERRASPAAGWIDLTDVAPTDLAEYLRLAGAAPALAWLREGSQRVITAPARPVPPPAGARVLPASYTIRSEHQVGFVLTFGVAF